MGGILVRVGIDSSCGNWCSPLLSDGRYLYVPIPESEDRNYRRNLRRPYSELMGALSELDMVLPDHLRHRDMHLDPDFDYLTFGDQGQRAAQIVNLVPGDFLAFYGALKRYDQPKTQLYYCLFGLITIYEIVSAIDVPEAKWHENAHTRRSLSSGNQDIIVRGVEASSGRFDRPLPIGEYRNRAYRVRTELLDEWGGLNVNDGYIQRSARLPVFNEPERFIDWLNRQNIRLQQSNWP